MSLENELEDTLKTINQGYYINKKKERVVFGVSQDEMCKTTVFRPGEIYDLLDNERTTNDNGGWQVYLTREDTLEAAERMYKKSPQKVVILNFAHPKTPGGSLRRRVSLQQEESLCF